jgi:hypothetical protein
MLACFGYLYHHDILIDYERSDLAGIRNLLEKELASNRIRHPHRFGRLLYDRFNDLNTEVARTDHLLNPDVLALLDGTPQGVYQVGSFVSGPLGILESQERRLVPPALSLPLWHCSDTGCMAVHQVDLVPPNIQLVLAYRAIGETLLDHLGPRSEWKSGLEFIAREGRVHGDHEYYPGRPYIDMPAFLSECLLGDDRTALFVAALNSPDGAFLRRSLAQPPRRRSAGEGSADQLSSSVPPEAQVQLLLLLRDPTLVHFIDTLVARRSIRLSIGEKRRAVFGVPSLIRDSRAELSALGIRSTRGNLMVNLVAVIWDAYQEAGLMPDLEWRIRGGSVAPAYDSLVAFLRARDPAESVRSLILSSQTVTQLVCRKLLISPDQAVDASGADRILWKLGFDPPQFETWITRFSNRLRDFTETVLAVSPIETEDARDRVRAAGVNVFVSVEEFLDKLIAYNVWLLAVDHFLNTFILDLDIARATVGEILGASLTSGSSTLPWSRSADNPVGVLSRYLSEAALWMKQLENADRDLVLRRDVDLPHYARERRRRFPFTHVQFWADTDVSQLGRHCAEFTDIAKLLQQADLTGIRNGLDHWREPDRFPTAENMLACATRIGQALEKADIKRFLPKVFWLYGRKATRFGTVEYEFRDYAGRSAVAYGPDMISGSFEIKYGIPVVLAPGNLLGLPNASLRFSIRERNDHSKYWDGYPRRRHVGPTESEIGAVQRDDADASARPA